MNLFSFIKTQVQILDVIQDYASLKKAGHYWKGHCPFHHEKTASFTVSPHKEIFYCFGCHIGGDVISFIAHVENCSQKEAAYHLIERYQLTLPADLSYEKNETSKNFEKQQHYFSICKHVAYWCHTQLNKTPALLAYLHKRGFAQESIEQFTLGYFPGGLHSIKQLLTYMQQHNFLPTDLLEATILARGKTVFFSGFEDRLIFPIKDHLGRFCGFGGRVVRKDDQRPKYYNSRENTFFNKGSILFGFDQAKKHIQETETVFLVEGYTDCLAMVAHGYPNCVATLGTACTLEHLSQLARHAQEMVILYDSDKAGQQAILRLAELCWRVSLELKVLLLPAQEDPASFLHKGHDLSTYLPSAHNIFHFFIRSLAHDFAQKPLHEKVTLTRRCIEAIANIDEPLKQDILLQRAARAFDIPFQSLKKEIARLKNKSSFSEKPLKTASLDHNEQPPASDKPIEILEKKIFCAILNNVELVNKRHEAYLLEYLPAPLGTIINNLRQTRDEQGNIDFVTFFETLDDDKKLYVSKLLLEAEPETAPERFEQLLMQLHRKKWKHTVHAIQTQLTQARSNGNTANAQKILQNFLMLKKKMIQQTVANEGE